MITLDQQCTQCRASRKRDAPGKQLPGAHRRFTLGPYLLGVAITLPCNPPWQAITRWFKAQPIKPAGLFFLVGTPRNEKPAEAGCWTQRCELCGDSLLGAIFRRTFQNPALLFGRLLNHYVVYLPLLSRGTSLHKIR